MSRDESIREVVSNFLLAYNQAMYRSVDALHRIMEGLEIKREEYEKYLPEE